MSHTPEKPDFTDLREKGRGPDGQVTYADQRLFMQLTVFDGADADTTAACRDALAASGLSAVLYADVNNARGLAVLALSEDPGDFMTRLRPLLQAEPFGYLAIRPEYSMLGRSYAIGYERDLADTLLARPRRTVLNPQWPWAVWYPLRRSGGFARLDLAEQRAILGEHGAIGRAFGEANLAHDVRLAAHGLNADDNDFIIGLVGEQLMPLSAVVQTMRGTRQTGEFIAQMGPFFVGQVVWQAAAPAAGAGQAGVGHAH